MKSDGLQICHTLTIKRHSMKRVKHPTLVVLVIGLFFCAGCGRHYQPAQNDSLATNSTQTVAANQGTNQSDNSQWNQTNANALLYEANHDTNYQQAKDAALAYATMLYEEKMHHPELFTNPPPSEWPFPNYPAGPGNPLPPYVNFYSMNDPYPAYLLCEYQVDEKNYTQSNEPKWFKASLEQIRQSGSKKFPQIKWVAVIIENDAEWKANTIDQAHKVGAIFKASDVFDSSQNLSQLVADAQMDRHPFKYDTSQPTPGEQDRRLIVEQHAATNHTNTGSN
jgi:hypothetical protein